MSFNYSVFGLSLHSNVSIPGLKPADAPRQAADVDVHLGLPPSTQSDISIKSGVLTFVSSELDATGEPALRIWQVADGICLYLAYCDGTEFWLDRKGTSVWARWPDTSSLEDAATFLLGPVLGLLLRLRGVTCLHASAVAFDDHAVAFVGDEGAGKSTTAAAFARHGYPIISDDVVAIVERDGAFYVLPAYPYLSLWPDSVKILYGPNKTLPTFSANWDKRVLSLAEDRLRFEERSLPLGAIFILGERTSESAAPFLETPTAQESLVALVANSYATGMLDKEMRAAEFSLLGRILASVPVRRVRPHEESTQTDRMCEVIRECYDNVKIPA
ncbi:MAG TPA: hypothetical protein VEX69_08000 [Candidatus Limnocylindria bacterium]|nr:hypothetical protein [Candidatus Limnocylindria bacterium]